VTRRARLIAEVLFERARVGWYLRHTAFDTSIERLAVATARARASCDEIDEVVWCTGWMLHNRESTRTTCLQRAMVRFVMLRRRGLPVCFKVGIEPDSVPLQGHAWLELEGRPVFETEPLRCAVTFAFPCDVPS
jgi:hypothetical protein